MAWINLGGESYNEISQLKLNNISFKNYFNSLGSSDISVLPDEEIRKYIKIYQTSDNEEEKDNALHTIMMHNQALIMSVVSKYGNKDNCADLIGDANIALYKSIEGFDLENKTCKFYGYALMAIFREICKKSEMYTNSMYHTKNYSDIKKLNKYIQKFVQENFREPTEEEIKDYIQESDDIKSTYEMIKYLNKSSIDSTSSDSEDDDFYNKTMDMTSSSAYYSIIEEIEEKERVAENMAIINKILNNWVNSIKNNNIKNTKKRNIELLFKYYGLNGYTQKSTQDLMEEYNLTDSSISFAIKECIYKIRKTIMEDKNIAEEYMSANNCSNVNFDVCGCKR